ncbi:hypothetical protein UZ38_02680 [Bacillus amyloliquefaciens]|nr:hypothetical protein UZ38_02680 [Bacillus amyloliquefaciens]
MIYKKKSCFIQLFFISAPQAFLKSAPEPEKTARMRSMAKRRFVGKYRRQTVQYRIHEAHNFLSRCTSWPKPESNTCALFEE